MMPTAQKSALIINDENLNPNAVGSSSTGCDEAKNGDQYQQSASCNQSGGQQLNSSPFGSQQPASPAVSQAGGDLLNSSLQQSGSILKSSSQSSNNSSSSAKLSASGDLNENEKSSSYEKSAYERSPHDKSGSERADRPKKTAHQPAERTGHERASQDRSSLANSTSKDSQKLLSDMTNNNIVDCLAKDSTAKDLNELNQTDSSRSGHSSNRDSQVSQLSQASSNLSGNLSGNLSSNNLSTTSSSNDQKSKHKKFVNNKNRDSSSSNGSLVESTNLTGNLLSHKEEQPAIKWKYSKTHQKRFKRRFPAIEQDEQLIDCKLLFFEFPFEIE